jgi:dTDP-4-amino-4,6-dideoxygalactose transaminase
MGLLQLDYIDSVLARRNEIELRYRAALADVEGLSMLEQPSDTKGNASYFPIFVDANYPLSRDALYQKLIDAGIHGRRYFYPLLSDMPMYRGLPSAKPEALLAAHRVANAVICLPIYPSLNNEQVDRITELIVRL